VLNKKKINLRGLSEILSERELKNVTGGSSVLGKECKADCGAKIYCFGECTETTWCAKCDDNEVCCA
jgi:hypothetical protein